MSKTTSKELVFEFAGLKLAAQQWGKPTGHPVIALHGWLDNSGSFNAIAPLLENINLIALDMAGHGKSDFRSADASYNIWKDVPELFAVADQLGWDTFSLLAHSRGAIVSEIAAGTFPDRIERMVLIDTLGSLAVEPGETPQQLARATSQRLNASVQQARRHSTLDKAIASRTNGFTSLSVEASGQLALRGVTETEQGFYWHADQRLKAASDLKMTTAQFNAFVKRIDCPVLLCMGEDGLKKTHPQFVTSLAPLIADCREVEFPGGHHLHMEESAPAVAEAINRFFAE